MLKGESNAAVVKFVYQVHLLQIQIAGPASKETESEFQEFLFEKNMCICIWNIYG